jgi:hypothetical protein
MNFWGDIWGDKGDTGAFPAVIAIALGTMKAGKTPVCKKNQHPVTKAQEL